MDNFTVIYKILKTLEQAMDYDEFDVKQISHTRLNISYKAQYLLPALGEDINHACKIGIYRGHPIRSVQRRLLPTY